MDKTDIIRQLPGMDVFPNSAPPLPKSLDSG